MSGKAIFLLLSLYTDRILSKQFIQFQSMETTKWQIKLSSLKDRNLYAFDKSLFCDVEFSVLDANGDKVTIPAHKYVLAISSPVFEAMFYGELAETGPIIDLPDCTKEGLQQTLRYVYSDEVNLSGSNVLEVLYQAEKYMLPFLKKKCEEYLEKQLQPEDVFHVLPQIRNEKVGQQCWDMVDGHTERAVSSESFLHISKEMLCRVLRRDTLAIDEVVLFQAVEKWALNKIRKKGLEENTMNKREVLGEDVIKLIRFPLMSEKKFAEKVLPTGILEKDEITELIQLYNELTPLTSLFSNIKRENFDVIIPSNRFSWLLGPEDQFVFGSWPYSTGRPDALDFKVNKTISLAGVRFFGSENSTYDVDLNLYKSDQRIQQMCCTIQNEKDQTDRYYGFTLNLDKPVPLDPDVVYTIEANIRGPNSYHGENGKTTVVFEDIVITYMDSKKSKNGTSSTRGQFPTLIFRRH